ncbi:MAG: imidazole glycerol phosphate synthase subunit HisF [Bacteroidetes bacterium]|nr:imidazole glycerol phosphate synthase subunit HisF [Bacteroidota bacterium]MBS1539734.1 imidazole glycerol phosphate synthase subunit HisF [Bacteroidota bacterium]
MKRFRVIPALLLQDGGLVKSIRFRQHKYVGDPINAVKIFNEKGVDEIVLLDRSTNGKGPHIEKLKDIASEAFMPMGYGGGITTIHQIRELILGGFEKVILNTSAFETPQLITEGAQLVGSQSIVAGIDVKKNWLGKYKVYVANGTKNTGADPVAYAKKMEQAGAGEILLTCIDRDGTFEGFDVALVQAVSRAVSIPVVAAGGAGSIEHLDDAVRHGASAVAAGSMFVFQLPHRAVLISYPSETELKELFSRVNL